MAYLLSAAREVLTAKLSSMGSSGGTTLVTMRTQSRSSLLRWRSSLTPSFQTYHEAATAKTVRKRMKKRASTLFAETRSVAKIMVLTRLPWLVSKPVLMTTATAPLSGGGGTPDESLLTPLPSSSASLPCETWRTLVPPQRNEFLSRPSGSMRASPGRNCTDSLSTGVLSPESIASLTMAEPSSRSMSHATPESSLVLPALTTSPGSSLSLITSCHFFCLYT